MSIIGSTDNVMHVKLKGVASLQLWRGGSYVSAAGAPK